MVLWVPSQNGLLAKWLEPTQRYDGVAKRAEKI